MSIEVKKRYGRFIYSPLKQTVEVPSKIVVSGIPKIERKIRKL